MHQFLALPDHGTITLLFKLQKYKKKLILPNKSSVKYK